LKRAATASRLGTRPVAQRALAPGHPEAGTCGEAGQSARQV